MMTTPSSINGNAAQQMVFHTPSASHDVETAAMSEMLKCANQRRAVARAREQGARQDRIHKMEAAVAKLKSAANWTLAGAIVNGTAGIASATVGMVKASNVGDRVQATAEVNNARDAATAAEAKVKDLSAKALTSQETKTKIEKKLPITPEEAVSKDEALEKAKAATQKAQTEAKNAQKYLPKARAKANAAEHKASRVLAPIKAKNAKLDAAAEGLGVLKNLQLGQVASSYLEGDRRELELAAERDGKLADDARQTVSDASQAISTTLGQIEKINEARQRAMSHAVRV